MRWQYFVIILIFVCKAVTIVADENSFNDQELDIPDSKLPLLVKQHVTYDDKSKYAFRQVNFVQKITPNPISDFRIYFEFRYIFDDGSIASETAKIQMIDEKMQGIGEGYFRFNIECEIHEFTYKTNADGIDAILSKFSLE